LHRTAPHGTTPHRNAPRRNAPYCNTLQHPATHAPESRQRLGDTAPFKQKRARANSLDELPDPRRQYVAMAEEQRRHVQQ